MINLRFPEYRGIVATHSRPQPFVACRGEVDVDRTIEDSRRVACCSLRKQERHGRFFTRPFTHGDQVRHEPRCRSSSFLNPQFRERFEREARAISQLAVGLDDGVLRGAFAVENGGNSPGSIAQASCEVRALRSELVQAASVSVRMQVLVARLSLQKQRLNALRRQLIDLHAASVR